MDMWADVDTAITVPVNLLSLIDDTDFITRETGVVYNQAGMDLVWNFQTTAGVTSQTAVTPTTSGDYDWTHSGDGMYKIEIPASGGASINNDAEGFGWFTGICTGVLAWRGPVIGFRAAALNNALIDGGDNLDVNIVEISGDSTAADNLESQYDETGLSGGTFPSNQDQLSGLANVGSAINRPASSYTLTTGTQSANTFVETAALDAVRHEHTDDAGAIELYYEVNIGSGTASSCQVTGYVTGNNDTIDVYGYDWVAAEWVQIGSIIGTNSTSNGVHSFDLFVNMTGSGANAGKVRIRFYKASGLTTAVLAIDQFFVSFNQAAGGYEGGAIWIDTNASNTNTVVGVDGTTTNPVSTIDATNTLLASTNLNRVSVAPGSSITLAAGQETQSFIGALWAVALGGQSVSGSLVVGSVISGICTGAIPPEFRDCEIGLTTLPACEIKDSSLENTITLGTGFYHLHNPHGHIDGALDFGAAVGDTSVDIGHFSGHLTIENLGANGTDTLSIRGHGKITLAASCVGGTVNWDGHLTITNNGSGITINKDEISDNVDFALVQIGVAGAGLTEIKGSESDTLETISDQITALSAATVRVIAGGGTSTPAYAVESESSLIVQGDVVSLARYIVGNQTGKRLFFGAKESTGDSAYIVGIIEANSLSYDSDTDLTSYLIPFVSADTKTVDPRIYKGETEIRDADGVSNPVTGDRYDFEVAGEIVT